MSISDTESAWCAVTVWCQDWRAAERLGVSQLARLLTAAERTDGISLWWFTRKAASWRLRWRPGRGGHNPAEFGDGRLRGVLDGDAVYRWAPAVYEPEIHAFGGPAGMDVAHLLFHHDSHNVLAHLGRACPEHRAEIGLVLAAALLNAAGQDYYEQGDVWTRVAGHRRTRQAGARQSDAASATRTAVRQLLAARTLQPLEALPAWPAAFRHAGRSLASLADQGQLTRGLRAVLAHHILFAWNRLGIPASDQAQLAHTAADIIFDDLGLIPDER
ncbi:thiopeptide-type bacteriocin biosynthesis protein [Frankia sp. AgPm24]|uniref:thiopeptide-type bacteriocin biosynthesis protein n=1 Tax=Frankia sp. AgPm24 TaxID=631128 RepID=UPI002010394C|nr:thiopeptide-type bacteriocin biosynthesis protein [Frankia sp. AgPm24]MCK9922190.1 thiopeptide-type bacteriocin biosynthesis protein [Frankia sp. AgPm24]